MGIKTIFRIINSPLNQFIIGIILNLLFVGFLLSFSDSSYNLRAPIGKYSDNIWKKSDVHTYVNPAIQFLEKGSFNAGNIPDYHRTIGYPLFLSIFMRTSSQNWDLIVIFTQAILYALMYPLIYGLIRQFLPEYHKLPVYTFIFTILSGTYISYTAVLYTDMMFALTFLAGIYCCIKGVEKNSVFYIMLELIIIGYAAEVRPTLTIFPILNILLIIYFSRRKNGNVNAFAMKSMVVSTVFLLLLCNGPSIRNYVNYGVFIASDVMHNNLSSYLSKNVMHDLGQDKEYEILMKNVRASSRLLRAANAHDASSIELLRYNLNSKNDVAHSVLLAHPFLTVKRIAAYGLYNSFDYHWGYIFNYWSMHWHKDPKFLKVSKVSIFFFSVWAIVYLVIYIFFIIFVFKLMINRDYILFLILLLMFLPFLATFTGGGGARMRLSVEWIIVSISFLQMSLFFEKRCLKKINQEVI